MHLHDMRKVLMPNGRMYTYYKSEEQTWQEIVRERILPDWQDYCNTHWIDFANHDEIWSFERKVHAFLDRLGWLCILDDIQYVESEYMSNAHKAREIPASECPAEISDMFYSDETPPAANFEDGHFDKLCDRLDEIKAGKTNPHVKKRKTKFQKLEDIRKRHPQCVLTWCIVNADNVFTYLGNEYTIPASIEVYQTNDDGWSMDRILVVDCGTDLLFYDQNVEPLDMNGQSCRH